MKKGLKIALILAILAIIVAAVFLQKKNTAQKQMAAQAEYLYLSRLMVEKHDYTTIISETEKYLQKDPNNLKMLYLNGASKFALGQYPEAQEVFTKILSLDPQNEPAKNYLEILKPVPGKTIMTQEQAKALELTKSEFEAKIQLTFDSSVLGFSKASPLKIESVAESYGGVYVYLKSYEDSVKYLKNKLKNLNPQISEQSDSISFFINQDNGNKQITISLSKTNKAVSIGYTKIK